MLFDLLAFDLDLGLSVDRLQGETFAVEVDQRMVFAHVRVSDTNVVVRALTQARDCLEQIGNLEVLGSEVSVDECGHTVALFVVVCAQRKGVEQT